jgi:hypothetical protein
MNNRNFIPKGYRLLRHGEPYPVRYWYMAKDGSDTFKRNIIYWYESLNVSNEFTIERFNKRRSYYFIIVKK